MAQILRPGRGFNSNEAGPVSGKLSSPGRGDRSAMKDIRWAWVLVGALLANVAVTAIITPIAIVDGQERLGYVAPPASFVGVLIVAWWIAGKAPHRAGLHGVLVGLVAMLLYLP